MGTHRIASPLGQSLARSDGRFAKLLAGYAKTDLLILDDWGLAPFTAAQRRDMLELLDDRYGNRSTLVTSQMPVDKWHALIGDPTLGDAILDRLVQNAYRIELKGESMRRRATKLTAAGTSDEQFKPASLRSDCLSKRAWNERPNDRGLGVQVSWNPHAAADRAAHRALGR